MKREYHLKERSLPELYPGLLQEIKEIKKAFKNIAQIKAGKLKARPATELLNELQSHLTP
jgi:hypothetical protein